MQFMYKKRGILQAATATFAVVAALGLSACGGGDDGGGSSSAASNDASAGGGASGGGASSIRVEGQSQALSGSRMTVAVLTPPVAWKADGSVPGENLTLSVNEIYASQLKSQAPGAYTTLPQIGKVLSLSTGVVTDIAGNGDFAIGRWAAGSDSAGHAYNANQGQTWAVGAPLTVNADDQPELTCSLAAATRPTATDGNTAPGLLRDATAVVTVKTDSFGKLFTSADLTLQYSIGADTNQTFVSDTQVGSMHTSVQAKASLLTKFMGPSASTPYLVVSYGVLAPTTGGINGLAVLSCK
ncbi:TPA: hypothetical protein ACW2VG_006747 [Burkholderia stabilis]